MGSIYQNSGFISLVNVDEILSEPWEGRPASEWSVKRIGILQSKIEHYTYQIYHNRRYGKMDLRRLIPGHILIHYANEAFGYDGWHMDVLDIESHEAPIKEKITGCGLSTDAGVAEDPQNSLLFAIVAEANVKITLKDGTSVQHGGIGNGNMPSKGASYDKAKKQAVTDAFKKCILSFESIIMDHQFKVENNYYVDGLYGSNTR